MTIVEALRELANAFGGESYGKTASEAILDVADAVYDGGGGGGSGLNVLFVSWSYVDNVLTPSISYEEYRQWRVAHPNDICLTLIDEVYTTINSVDSAQIEYAEPLYYGIHCKGYQWDENGLTEKYNYTISNGQD